MTSTSRFEDIIYIVIIDIEQNTLYSMAVSEVKFYIQENLHLNQPPRGDLEKNTLKI